MNAAPVKARTYDRLHSLFFFLLTSWSPHFHFILIAEPLLVPFYFIKPLFVRTQEKVKKKKLAARLEPATDCTNFWFSVYISLNW